MQASIGRAASKNAPFVNDGGFGETALPSFPHHNFRPTAYSALGLFIALGLVLSPGAGRAADTTITSGTYTGINGNTGTATFPVTDDNTSNNNTLTLGNGSAGPTIADTDVRVAGGYARGDLNGSANDNTLTVNGGTFFDTTYGAYIRGGWVEAGSGDANSNTVTINGFTQTNDISIYGGTNLGSGNAAGNIVTISSGNTNNFLSIYGGDANTGDATSNIVNIAGGGQIGYVYGGYTTSGNAGVPGAGNIVNVSGYATVGSVYGSYARNYSGTATASGNTVNINGGSVTGRVIGGRAYSNSSTATADGNAVNISGGSVTDHVIGGYADSDGTDMSGNAVNNSVVISGGQIAGNIYGGFSLIDGNGETGSATGNSITLIGAPVLNGSLYGGFVGDWNGNPEPGTDALTGNTLNLHAGSSTALTVNSVQNFQTYNFYLSDTKGANNPASDPAILTVTNAVDLSASEVHVAIEGKSSPLKVNDEVNLIAAPGLTANAPTNTDTKGEGMQGVTLKYEFDLDSTSYPDQLVAKVTKATLAEESKSLSEGYLSSTAFLTQGSDFLTRRGVSAAQEEVKNARLAQGREYSSFIALGGGKVRNETGSHIDVSGYHLLVGLASAQKLHNSELTLAGFIEYGEGDYTSHNSFNSGKIKGKGDTRYQGLGVLARNEYPSGLYLDASLRIGQTDTDFKANLGQATKFDTRSTYTGAHLGIGKNWTLNETGTLGTYGQILYTRQQSDSVTLSTGEKVKFDAIDSERIRIGTRYQHKLTNAFTGYAGIAYDHEFGGKAKAKTNGYKIDAPSLKGGSGMFEIGLTGKPAANKPLFLDLGIQGYAGKRESVMGSLRVNYRF
ncbi:membrane protein [Betaproteobacteria bacterium]|nr:membrane protein [Betaproteobacteria bacterium]